MRLAMRSLIVAILLTPLGAHALEAPRTFRAEYRISYLGFKVADSSFVSTFTGDQYQIEGRIRSAGLARLFDRTDARTRVTGRLSGDSMQPDQYLLNYFHRGQEKATVIRYGNGGVDSAENRPPLGKRGSDWVPLDAADLAAALDPISGTLIRAASAREVCNRTIRAFDGEIRVDLPLSFAGIRPFSTEGFKGDVVRCKAGFEPVSGYRKGRRALEFMRQKQRIEIEFAPVGDTGVHAPARATVETEVGPVRLYATRFSLDD